MPIHTRRWNDPPGRDEGQRLLVCRYRPRGVRRDDETWDAWVKELAPSATLHADYFGKHGPPIGWEEYRRRYLEEMEGQDYRIGALADEVAAGQTITLLCSSHCTDAERCHRKLLQGLIERRMASRPARGGR
jgi:uncharacterized protein YeaO (DUF488 family)